MGGGGLRQAVKTKNYFRFFTHEGKKGGAGVSGLIAIISSSTNCTKEPCFCFFGGGLGILNIYEQTPGSKAFVFLTKKPLKCASSKQAPPKKRPWISLLYVQEKLGGDLGSTVQYSMMFVCPAWTGVCSSSLRYFSKCFHQQSALQQRMCLPQYFHAHSQMYKQYYSFRTQ